jgi:YcxB-like protein
MPDNAPVVIVRGTIRPADWLRAWRYAQRRRFRAFRLLALFVLVLFGIVSSATGRVQVFVLMAAVLLATVPLWATSVARRTIRTSRALHGPHILTFADDGLRARKGSTEERSDWSLFRGFQESEHDLMLLSGRSRVVCVPKRLFDDAAQLDEVRRLLARKLGSPATGRPDARASR